MKVTMDNQKYEIRKVQGLVKDQSFSVTIPRVYANHLKITRGSFLKIYEKDNKIILEKAD